MTYTAPEVLGIIAAVGVLITAVGAAVVNIIVALRTGQKIDIAAAKTDGLIHQVQEVHTLTNSNLSAVKAELAVANALNMELRTLIVDLKGERGKLAALTAASKTTAETALLGSIDTHTEETAINTAQPPVVIVPDRRKDNT